MFNMSTCSLKFNSEECSAFIKVLDFTVINATLITSAWFFETKYFGTAVLFCLLFSTLFLLFSEYTKVYQRKIRKFRFRDFKGILGSALLAILLCEVIRYTLAQVYPQGILTRWVMILFPLLSYGIYYRFLLFCVFAIYFLSIRPEKAPGWQLLVLPKTAWQLKRHCETNTQTCSWTLLFMMSGIFRGSMM